MAFEITEQSIIAQSPNETTMLDAQELARTGALKNLSKTDDGSIVFADCRGSRGGSYSVAMDLGSGTDKPTLSCTCPSRQRPCKHILGLMLMYVQKAATFSIAPAPKEILDKRAKDAEKAAPKKRERKDGPRNVNQDALAKKGKEQIDALETLGAFLVDLVNVGVGGITPKMREEIAQQSKRMMDTNVMQAAYALKRLGAALGNKSDDDDDDDDDDKDTNGAGLNLSKETEARVAWMITLLHAMVRRGTKLLDGRLAAEGVSAAELDATYDLILSKRWQLRDLKHAGHWVTNRTLLELAHERRDDPTLEFVEATGYLIDLGDGSIVREWSALPYHAVFQQTLRASRRGALVISEAGLYPGEMVNRRIRWDDKVEGACTERVRKEADYEALHSHAKPIDAVLKAFRAHLRNPLHPLDAVFLVAVQRFGTLGFGTLGFGSKDAEGDLKLQMCESGAELIVEDAAKDRLVMRDMPEAIVSATTALRQAGAAYGSGSLAVRLFFDLPSRSIHAEPLALFVGDEHLRLHT